MVHEQAVRSTEVCHWNREKERILPPESKPHLLSSKSKRIKKTAGPTYQIQNETQKETDKMAQIPDSEHMDHGKDRERNT